MYLKPAVVSRRWDEAIASQRAASRTLISAEIPRLALQRLARERLPVVITCRDEGRARAVDLRE
jgi:hypothetical protein